MSQRTANLNETAELPIVVKLVYPENNEKTTDLKLAESPVSLQNDAKLEPQPKQESKEKLRSQPFPYYLPLQVEVKHIRANGNEKIVSNDMIAKIMQTASEMKENTIFNVKGVNYPIIKHNEKCYAVYKKIGGGNFGKIELAQDLESGEWVALKTQNKIDDGQEEYLNLKDIGRAKGELIVDSQHIIIMDYAHGVNLFDLVIKSQTDFPPEKWMEIAVAIIEEVNLLHKNNLLHRDIKLENIMYDIATGKVTIVDVGHDLIEGTVGYMAPEAHEGVRNEKTDIFSLGMTLAALLDLAEVNSLTHNIYTYLATENTPQFADNIKIPDTNMRGEVINLLLQMTSHYPEERPNLEDSAGKNGVITQFRTFQDKLLTTSFTNVGILDIKEFLDSKNDPLKRNALINALKTVDEVWLIDTRDLKDRDGYDYFQLRKDLEKKGVNLQSKLFSEPGKKVADVVAEIPNSERGNEKDKIRNYLFVTGNKPDSPALDNARVCTIQVTNTKTEREYRNEVISYVNKQQILPEHRNNFVNLLKQEQDRLNKKKPKAQFAKNRLRERVEALEKAIGAFEKGEINTYQQAFDKLADLKKNMLTTSKTAQWFAKKLPYTPTVRGKNVVEAISRSSQRQIYSSRLKR